MKGVKVEDIYAVLSFLRHINQDDPYPEKESYFFRSPKSGHIEMHLKLRYGWLRKIFDRANPQQSLLLDSQLYQKIAINLENVFIIGCLISAVYDELTEKGATFSSSKKDLYWLQKPFSSAWQTFMERWLGHAPIWSYKDAGQLRKNPFLIRAKNAYERVFCGNTCRSIFKIEPNQALSINLENAVQFRKELEELHRKLKSIMTDIFKQILEDLP